VLQDAWARGQKVSVHGWVYGLKDGLLKDLQCTMDGPATVVEVFASAQALPARPARRSRRRCPLATTFDIPGEADRPRSDET
jgi:hypothetical protein